MNDEQRLKYLRIFLIIFGLIFCIRNLSDDELDMAFRLGMGTSTI